MTTSKRISFLWWFDSLALNWNFIIGLLWFWDSHLLSLMGLPMFYQFVCIGASCPNVIWGANQQGVFIVCRNFLWGSPLGLEVSAAMYLTRGFSLSWVGSIGKLLFSQEYTELDAWICIGYERFRKRSFLSPIRLRRQNFALIFLLCRCVYYMLRSYLEFLAWKWCAALDHLGHLNFRITIWVVQTHFSHRVLFFHLIF